MTENGHNDSRQNMDVVSNNLYEPQNNCEERYKNLFDTLPIGIYRSTLEGNIIQANSTLIKMLGYDSYEEFVLRAEANLIYANKTSRPDFLQKINTDGEVIGFESVWLKKNNNEIWVRENSKVIKDENNNILFYEGTVEDITAQKIAEDALLKSEKQLRDLNTMKDKFFSVIAHDLRSPFQGLLGMASILVDEEFDLSNNERRDFTKKLYEGLKTQFALLDNLLTWSRLQRGVIEFAPTLNDLIGEVHEACAVLNNSAEKKNINITTNLPSKMIALYDKNMIATVIRNLLSNAIKFTHNNGTISITAAERECDFLVTVQDNGVGILEENVSKLFRIDSLYSMHGTNDEGGTGLGLILCKEFIEKHSGNIWVESEFGKGSIIYFTIPKNNNAD